MRRSVETIAPDASVHDAARRMRERRVGTLIVCDAAGAPIGIVTDSDVARRDRGGDRPSAQVLVAAVMTPRPLVCRERRTIWYAESQMERHAQSGVVIIDQDGKLRGLLSLSDVLRYERPSLVARVLYALAARKLAPARA